jgi:hypothetical protein
MKIYYAEKHSDANLLKEGGECIAMGSFCTFLSLRVLSLMPKDVK